MKDFICFFAAPMISSLFAMWLVTAAHNDSAMSTLGSTVSDYEAIKQVCEEAIPRNKRCKAVVKFEIED